MGSVELLDSTVQLALDYLCRRYHPQLVFLYGSFACNQQTATSDIDILCFADLPEFLHDSEIIQGHRLDAWIYPLAKLDNIVEFKYILPCLVLKDEASHASELLVQLQTVRAAVVPMTVSERAQHLAWIDKMLQRARADTAEGNYRYHWLLFEFPESYCRLRNEYFDGPVKTLKRMAQSCPGLFARYEQLLSGSKSVSLLAQLYNEITTSPLGGGC